MGTFFWQGAMGQRRGQLLLNSSLTMVDAALSGYGIAHLPENLVVEHRAGGRLIQVLDEWSPMFDGCFLYYPSRRQNSPSLSVLVDALQQR